MTGSDTRDACSACKRRLVGPRMRRDEEDGVRSVIIIYYSPNLFVHVNNCTPLGYSYTHEECLMVKIKVKSHNVFLLNI